MPLEDEFHKEMRRRMAIVYHEKGGKKRKQLYTQLRKLKAHNITNDFFKDDENIDKKILKIKAHFKALKKSLIIEEE
jgi:hypothetical protein